MRKPARAGRTYRYFRGEPLYRFGDGISFSRFEYSDLALSSTNPQAGQPVEIKVTVKNTSQVAGGEVVELYLDRPFTSPGMPFRTLQGFRRVHLNGGESRQITFSLAPRQLAFVDADGKLIESPGAYTISVGGHQPAATPQANQGTELQQTVTITGNPITLD